MKKAIVYFLFLLPALMCSCKQDKWMDWKLQNEMWLAENAKKENVQITPSGLQYKVLYNGNQYDAKPDDASTVLVSYTGTLINGYKFDSSSSTSFPLSGVVKGFAEGLKKIHVHGDIELYIPQELAYADSLPTTEGSLSASFIPPYSTLIFQVHLYGVSKQ
ncbi:MAG: FKBP-type peptidyl-prolyl cis-trans isomerase [Paludibacteraceae bacterium]|nr:FKBP-type peptidyl-prolyl cis-trans isomerase [Paludibacteraceae bacterium]